MFAHVKVNISIQHLSTVIKVVLDTHLSGSHKKGLVGIIKSDEHMFLLNTTHI